MILEYYRPDTIEEALRLLARHNPVTLPMGGGTILNRPSDEEFAVVDLQALGLDEITQQGQTLSIGATAKMEKLKQFPGIQASLKKCIRLESTYNLRQMRTVAGSIVSADGRSPLTTALLALDAQLKLEPGGEEISIGNLLPARIVFLPGRLITQVNIPLSAKLAFHSVSRTPADFPLVSVAAAQWPSGRTRVALGGHGNSPLMAMDGPEAAGAVEAARIVYDQAEDQWASAEYRRHVAATLTQRCLDDLTEHA